MNQFSWCSKILFGFAFVFALVPAAHAEFPVDDMDSYSLGLQYGLTFRGENITQKSVPAHEVVHTLSLAYAPIQYLSLEAGLGLDALSVESNNQTRFNGAFGFAPNFGISVFSPKILDMLKFSLGSKSNYLNSQDDAGFQYTALSTNSFLSAIVSPIPYVSASVGARLFLMDGTMTSPGSISTGSRAFSNQNILRGFFAVTIKSPRDGAFVTFDLDASPSLDSDLSHGPREASIGIAFGAVIGHKRTQIASADSSKYFSGFDELKAKQNKMAEDLK